MTLRICLARHGRTQEWLARRMGLALSVLGRQLTGERHLDTERLDRCVPDLAAEFHALRLAMLEASQGGTGTREVEQLGLTATVGQLSRDVMARDSEAIGRDVAAVVTAALRVERAAG